MKKTSKSILILVTLIIIFFLYLINSNLLITSIIDYSILFLTKLFPVSFIFFVLSNLLISYKLIENIEYYLHINTSKLYVLILSIISGFPSGAKYTKNLLDNNTINEDLANEIIKYSHFPNPLFVLGTVSEILKSKRLSLNILLAIYLSNIIILLTTKKIKSKNIINLTSSNSFSNELANAVNSSVNTIIVIYGTSLFFYLLSVIITKYLTLSPFFYVLINGIFDLTKGVTSTIILNNTLEKAILILLFISFGPLSIHMQVKSIIDNSKIKYTSFLKGRILSTILAIIIFLILIKI